MKHKNSIKKLPSIIIIIIGILLVIIGITYVDKKIQEAEKNTKDMSTLIAKNKTEDYAFWKYKNYIKTITFEDKINIPNDAVESWDVSQNKDGSIMAYIKYYEENNFFYDLYIQSEGKMYANSDSSHYFSMFNYLNTINNIELLDTSKVNDMSYMFYFVGTNSDNFKLDLGDNFDTSKVTNMSYMFSSMGSNSETFKLNLGSKFDTTNVKNMMGMFSCTGIGSKDFNLNLGNNFDTSNVTNMSYMFEGIGRANTDFILNLGDKFNFNNVTDMSFMFNEAKCNKIYLNQSNFNENVSLNGIFMVGSPTTVYVKSEKDKEKLIQIIKLEQNEQVTIIVSPADK